MIGVFKKIWDFAGTEQKNIRNSILSGFVNAMFHAMQLWALFVVLSALVEGSKSKETVFAALGIMLLSIAGKIVTQYVSQLQRTHAGYFMVAEKRVYIGDKLKVVPMGFFNQNSLGQLTAVATTTLSDVENAAPVVLVTSLGGFLNSLVFSLTIFLFDWRIGLIVAAGVVLFLYVVSLMEKRSRADIPKRQAAQATLVEKVLETIQGMSVVKAFDLDDAKGKKVDQAIDESCEKNSVLERAVNPYVAAQQIILNLCSAAILFASVSFYLDGTLSLVYCLMMMVSSFMVFEQLKTAGSSMANLRITESSISRANEIDSVPVMDDRGREIVPQTHNIQLEKVDFSYETRPVLQDVSLCIPDKTTTAIVGPSGSGKTTLCNLIARFWDVNGGRVSIGGHDVKDYTLDSLMANISMVFQNVYLFNDTIENNIKFGKPNATHDEVVAAAKKACCDDFIDALPDGYNTVVGEGGATLSGGEKQRLSIARAMLKDAPIVIFDEATANVDPENEDRLQAAIEALTRDKTIIMIAHRLKTVRHADQIVVLDGGRIVQRGTHDELLAQKGIYSDLVGMREKAIGWKLET